MSDQTETELPAVGGMSLGDLREAAGDELLAEAVDRLVAQVSVPRVNLGGTGPPGRAD